MKSRTVLSSLLLVGALTLATPVVASAHQEGRANCRYATQQSTAPQLALLGQVRQTAGVVLAGITTAAGELDRSLDRTIRRAAAMMSGLADAAGGASRMVQETAVTIGGWSPVRVLAPR